jgi:hypothetical protein
VLDAGKPMVHKRIIMKKRCCLVTPQASTNDSRQS